MRHLASEHEITLLGYDWPEQTPQPLPANVRVVSLPGPVRSRAERAAGWLGGFRSGLPVQSVGLVSPMLRSLREVLADESFDVAHVTASAIAELGVELGNIPKVLVSLDAWNLNAQSQTAAAPAYLRPARRLEEMRIERFIRRTFPVYDSVVTVADEDAQELQRLGANDRITVIPNGVDTEQFHPGSEASEDGLLVFVGTMRWAPNITAARFLCREVLPVVRERHPNAHVAIVGRAASEELRDELEQQPGVTVVGEVDDVGDWIRRAAVFCCPMLDGTGIKNKLLEGLACGAPVVATQLSCQGTAVKDGEHLLIGEDASQLAEAIDVLLADRALAARLGTTGREYVRQHHRWEAVAEHYAAEYQYVIGASRSGIRHTSERPTAPEQDLLTELLLRDDGKGRTTRMEALAHEVAWPAFEQLAWNLRVLPLAVHRLDSHPELGSPADLRQRVAEVTSAHARRGTLNELFQLSFITKCREAGFSAVALKGPELGRRIYGDPGLRPSGDLDVLVSLGDLSQAGALAAGLGYVAAPDLLDRHGRPLLHRTYVHPSDALPPLEIHWRVHWYESQFGEDALRRATEAPTEQFHLLPEDELIALMLFFARDGLQGIRYPADVFAWWHTYEHQLNLPELQSRYRDYPQLQRAIEAAARALEKQSDLKLCEPLGISKSGHRTQLAVNASSIGPARDPAEGSARAAVIDALVAPTPQIPGVILRRIVAPQATFETRLPSPRQVVSGIPHALLRLLGQLRILLQTRSQAVRSSAPGQEELDPP